MTEPFLKVQRVSLALWGIAFLGLLATILHRGWIALTGFVFIAGLAGMFVQATGRQRVLAIIVHLLLLVLMGGLIVSVLLERPSGGAILFIPIALVVLVLAGLNVWLIARLPKGDGLEQSSDF